MDDDLDFNDNEDYEYSAGLLNVFLSSPSPILEEVAQKIFKDVGFKGQKNLILNQIKVLVLNFIELKRRKSIGQIRYGRSNNYWAEYNDKMPNPWGITSKIDDVIDEMQKAGLLNVSIGFIKQKVRKQTRIQPSEKFTTDYIKPFNLLELPLEYHQDFPLIQVHIKYKDEYTGEIKHKRYSADGKTQIPNQLREARDLLKRYNRFIAKAKISLMDVPETFEARKNVLFDTRRRIYRKFNGDDMQTGGRFYGGWWMHDVKSELRQYITINGKRTVECDYKSQHAYMLYGHCLKKHMKDVLGANTDPYTLGNYPRDLGKRIFTIALNVRGRRNVEGALLTRLNEEIESDSINDRDTALILRAYVENDFYRIMDMFETLHGPVLKPIKYLYPSTEDKKWWRRFQFYDSQICAYVLNRMTEQKIVCLSVHDSFIVPEDKEQELKQAMIEAYTNADHIPDLSKCIPDIRVTRGV